MVWPVVVSGAGAGVFYWLGLRDARADRGCVAAGSRATGLLALFAIALLVASPSAVLLAPVPAVAYLAAWAIHRRRPAAVERTRQTGDR